MENQLLLLINDYLFQSKRAVSFLKDNFGKINLLRAVRKGEIPKDGAIKTVEYSFHGVGCIVFFDDCFIDFDFGPNGRFDGFDAWRLFNFAKQFPTRYANIDTIEKIENGLKKNGVNGNNKIAKT